MIWQTLTADEVVKRLRTRSDTGLSENEAQSRLISDGKNELARQKSDSLLKKFINQFNDYMIIILLIAAAVSFAIAVYEGSGDFVEPCVIISIVILNAAVGTFQENKAEKSLAELSKISEPYTTVLRDGTLNTISSSLVVRGDIIRLKAGDFAPADARIITCSEFYTDESSLTGESVPVKKSASVTHSKDTPIADMRNMVWSSTAVTGGNCVAVVTDTGMETQIGLVAKALTESSTPQTPLQLKLEKMGKLLGTIALLICAAVFVMGVFKNMSPMEMFMTSVSLAVAAIPEGLPAIVTVMLAIGVQKMASKNAIVKKLHAVETIGSASVICSDKTGTLTENKMTVTKIYGDPATVISTALLCSNNTDPTERAIFNFSHQNNISAPSFKRVKEIPFTSSAKFMATVNSTPNGFMLCVKGAMDVVLKRCKLTPDQRRAINSAHKAMTGDALRVLAVARAQTAHTPDALKEPLEFCGLIGICDPPRKEIYQAVKSCRKSKIKPVMITGDHIDTATAIARQIGITPTAVTGAELDKMSDTELLECVKTHCVFARVSPEHKGRIVRAFQSNGDVVAMTGDGVNDAPALKQADIGCAMGITGTDVAKGAADIVLTDDNFATIVDAIYEGRGIFTNIKKAIHFLFSSNIGEILTIFCAIAAGLPSPLTAVQLLWVNLITDSLPAIALGVDPDNKAKIIAQKPIKRHQGLFARGHATTIFLEGVMIGALALLAFCLGYFKYNSCDIGRTMAFSVLSLSQLVHAFNVRSEHSIFTSKSPFNKLLFGSLVAGVLLQIAVVVVPTLSTWFSTVPLGIEQWKTIAALSIMPIPAVEISKLVCKKE